MFSTTGTKLAFMGSKCGTTHWDPDMVASQLARQRRGDATLIDKIEAVTDLQAGGDSDPMRDRVGLAGERPSRADHRRAALHAGMGDVLKIVRRGAIFVQRGCDGCDRHPTSAIKAGKEVTRQVRWGNTLIAHWSSLPVARPPNSAMPIPRPIIGCFL